jgi:hypothetical protein
LEATFERTHYPEIRTVDDLSSELNLSIERISIWFQNRRARFKKTRKLNAQASRFENEERTPVSPSPSKLAVSTHLESKLPVQLTPPDASFSPAYFNQSHQVPFTYLPTSSVNHSKFYQPYANTRFESNLNIYFPYILIYT